MASNILKKLIRRPRLRWSQIRAMSETGGAGQCSVVNIESCDPCIVDQCKKQPRVVIVGAGVAGLSAANRLARCGLNNFLVLEASGRPGGRVHSCWLEDEVAELGAQWIQGGCIANPVYSLACSEGLIDRLTFESRLTKGQRPTVFLTSDGRAIEHETALLGIKLFSEIREQAAALFSLSTETNKTLKQFLGLRMQQELSSIPEELRYDVSRVLCSHINALKTRWGADADQISADQYGSFVSIPGTPMWICAGLVGILGPLLDGIPPQNIKYNSPVEKIEWGQDCIPVQVRCCNGECYTADYCIVTVSLGLLKEHAGRIFDPELPAEKTQAIEKLGYGFVEKVFLKYSSPFWGAGEGSMRLAWTAEELEDEEDWIKGVSSVEEMFSSRSVLVCTVAGKQALTLAKMCDEEVAEDLTKMIRRFTGDPTIPFPAMLLRSRWSSDPFFLGSGSYMGESSKVRDQCNLGAAVPGAGDPKAPRLLFAGEATAPGKQGTVHGARASGLREADRVLDLTRVYGGLPSLPLSCLRSEEPCDLVKPPPPPPPPPKEPCHKKRRTFTSWFSF